jgi:hypothetical protein
LILPFLCCVGDEVIEWNGRSLQGKSFQEVYDIIAESKQEPQVELIVSRILGSRQTPQTQWGHSYTSPTHMHKGNVLEVDINSDLHQDSQISGRSSMKNKRSDMLHSQES